MDTVKNLSKEVNKLDSFKRNVLRTLNEEAAETAADHMAVSPAVAGARDVCATCELSALACAHAGRRPCDAFSACGATLRLQSCPAL